MEGRRFRALEIGVPYHRQGLIFFTARCFDTQPRQIQTMVLDACERAGRENAEALFAYVTTGRSKESVMTQYYIASETTLNRMVRRFFHVMDEEMRKRGRR